MKKVILISLAALSAFLTASCEKEAKTADPVAKVPATLSVSVDDVTKTALDEDGLSIVWEGTESIGVFDGIATTPNQFYAAASGATTSFTGEVSDGAENFIVFYPYQADAYVSDVATSTIKIRMPSVQQAVKNGFDPAAGLAARLVTDLDEPVRLYNQFALLKVNVDQDGVTAITVSATNRKLAGGIALKVSSNGGSNGDSPTSNSVTLKNADDSALEQGIYYIAVRPSSTTSPYEGFKMEVVKNGVSKTRSASNDLVVARNHILSIGKVSTLFGEGDDPTPSYNGRYEAYMAGEDITVGGFTINKSTHGNATLLTAEDEAVALNKTSLQNGGVFFLRAVGTGSFKLDNNPDIKNSTYVLSDGDERVNVAFSNTFNLADNGVLGLQGLAITVSGKDYIAAVKNNTSSSFDSFLMDNCSVDCPKSLISTNSSYSSFGVKHIGITRSSFKISVATNLVTITSSYTGITDYKTFVFNHNVVYTASASNILTTIFNYTGTTGNQMQATVNNNLFYNVVNGGTFKHNTLASATATKNVFWAVDGTDPGANAKMWGMQTKTAIPTVNVTDNIAYGTLATGRKWVIADDTVNTGMEALQVAESNPIATADVTTGTFTMAVGYTSYGPQL